MREWLGIQPLPKRPNNPFGSNSPYTRTMNVYQPPSNTPSSETKGIVGGAISDIKSAYSQATATARSITEQRTKSTTRRTAGELRQAKAYEEKRRKELEKEKAEREYEKAQGPKRAKKGKSRHS